MKEGFKTSSFQDCNTGFHGSTVILRVYFSAASTSEHLLYFSLVAKDKKIFNKPSAAAELHQKGIFSPIYAFCMLELDYMPGLGPKSLLLLSSSGTLPY